MVLPSQSILYCAHLYCCTKRAGEYIYTSYIYFGLQYNCIKQCKNERTLNKRYYLSIVLHNNWYVVYYVL